MRYRHDAPTVRRRDRWLRLLPDLAQVVVLMTAVSRFTVHLINGAKWAVDQVERLVKP